MRTTIVGLFNPHSSDPDDALRPNPVGSAGYRLWKMLDDVNAEAASIYSASFLKFNLARTKDDLSNQKTLNARAQIIRMRSKLGSTIIVLGDDVRRAFSTSMSRPLEKIFLHPQGVDGITWRVIPHPSGRCLAYNDEATRLVVGKLLSDLSKSNQLRMGR